MVLVDQSHIQGVDMRRLLGIIAVTAVVFAACGTDTATTTTIADQSSDTAPPTTTTTSAPPETTAPATTQAPTTSEAQASGGGEGLLAAAARQSSEAQSGRFEAVTEVLSPEFGEEPVTMTIAGEFAADGKYSMTMDMTEIMAASDDIPQGFEVGEMAFIVDGEDAYMSFGLFAILGVATDWVKMPIDRTDETVGFGASGPTSPTSILDDFSEAGAEVSEVGRETIRGVETTHYLVTFDAAALESLEDTTSRAFADSGAEDLPVDVWIGDDGFLYQFELTVEDETGTTHMIYNIFDYGADIEITIPDEEDVTDFADLAIPTIPTG